MPRLFRRRERALAPSPQTTQQASDDRTATASRLHAFNRFEVKYLVPEEQVDTLRAEFARHMDIDANSGDGGYPVMSVYYDSPRLTFYWQKIEGLKFRRKLRIRHYGDVGGLHADSPVQVEIKQRVNRVTQKRRIELPYRKALALCAGDTEEASDGTQLSTRDRGFFHEVAALVTQMNLRPTVTTAYTREAWIGQGADLGLRVTLDHRLRGRDRDFHLASDTTNRLILPPRLAVLEIKANERVPDWITDLTARVNLDVVRISKYCQSVQAFDLAPRSILHAADELDQILTEQKDAS